ncbi:MAG: recombinase family protein [Ruminococcaceae bacterium]|nr:recombinase family protein [Oscillospiraceae bacterium]
MARIGYIRVSTQQQETARQEQYMQQMQCDKIFIEKISGKNTKRPELQAMLAYVREGDVLYIESISRLARSIRDLLGLVDMLQLKGVDIISSKENIDTSNPQGRFVLSVFAALAELEREQLLQRQAEGIAAAKAAGRYLGRAKITVDNDKFCEIYNKWQNGEMTARAAMQALDLKPNTFYRRVKEYEAKGGAD